MAEYSNAAKSSHGLMICGACNRSIEEGDYRAREKSDRYVTHHRECCSSDPEWAKRDAEAAARAAHWAAFSQACREFRDRWGVSDLNEYIEEIVA